MTINSQKAFRYLLELCQVQPNRRTGSDGNRQATTFFTNTIRQFGFQVDNQPFDCLDYLRREVSLDVAGKLFEVHGSPYSLDCDVFSSLKVVSTMEDLTSVECEGKILLLKDEISSEQLMPKNFVFYNPKHHQQIIALLEHRKPAAIITATGRQPDQVGALYPFPLIVDGDFDIPSVYCTDQVGNELNHLRNEEFHLRIETERIPSSAQNVVARLNRESEEKIVFCAHIDAYEDSPGASDNASGVVVLLLLAELLQSYSVRKGIEVVAFNGEDHYSVAGQMDYLKRYRSEIKDISLLVNIDDVGYRLGRSAFSLYGCREALSNRIRTSFSQHATLVEGDPWFSGDHMIFVQQEVPSLAFTAELMPELMRTVTHTAKDTPDLIDPVKLVNLAEALAELVEVIA